MENTPSTVLATKSMSKIPDYTPEELKAISDCLQERYGENVPFEQADIELRLSENDSQVTECPAVYWEKGGCHFIVAKTDEVQYFSQFFYGNREQFGTGKPFYNDLLDCVLTTLRVQADHELQKNNAKD
ncbi:hypothetical protein MNBD_GAMMA23-2111 [hydrothermal vent metagenome]|uniref:Uncharacterized protein n=1 Tax=hydrothermal vent metagenome TaxID=652676 RepID=A0A3B0ZIE3_9ZZZZ